MHIVFTRMQRSLEGGKPVLCLWFQFLHCRSPTGSGRGALLAKSWHSSLPSLSWHKRLTILFEFGTCHPLVFPAWEKKLNLLLILTVWMHWQTNLCCPSAATIAPQTAWGCWGELLKSIFSLLDVAETRDYWCGFYYYFIIFCFSFLQKGIW